LGAVIGSIFVVSKISAGVAATIAVIKSLIIAYNALKATAIVAGVAAAFALNPLLGVGAVAAAAVVMAAAVKLAGTSDIDVDALGVATGSSNFTYNQGNPLAIGSTASANKTPTIKVPTITVPKMDSPITNGMRDMPPIIDANGELTARGRRNLPPEMQQNVTVNIGVAGNPEATARVITETLNDSFYRGTRGAGLLAGIQ